MSGFVGVCSWTRGSGSRERCIDGRRKFSVARMSIPGASIDENIVDVLRARGLVDAVTHEEIREVEKVHTTAARFPQR